MLHRYYCSYLCRMVTLSPSASKLTNESGHVTRHNNTRMILTATKDENDHVQACAAIVNPQQFSWNHA
jgi:hypothetical protein